MSDPTIPTSGVVGKHVGKFLQGKEPLINLLWIKLVLWKEWVGQESDLFSHVPEVGVRQLAVELAVEPKL